MFIIPMVGKSSRFFNDGYALPKHQLELGEHTVFYYALKSFEKYFSTDFFVFVVMDEHGNIEFIENQANALGIKNYEIKVLNIRTEGQAETVAKGIEGFDESTPIYIFNIDSFRLDFTKASFSEKCDGYLEVFQANGEHWSFVEPGEDNKVVLTTEKNRVSDLCSNGLYYFKNISLFLETFKVSQDEGARVKGEFYVAPLYNYMIKKGMLVKYNLIPSEKMIFCGTPNEYESVQRLGYGENNGQVNNGK